jgi:hypothetical protein
MASFSVYFGIPHSEFNSPFNIVNKYRYFHIGMLVAKGWDPLKGTRFQGPSLETGKWNAN